MMKFKFVEGEGEHRKEIANVEVSSNLAALGAMRILGMFWERLGCASVVIPPKDGDVYQLKVYDKQMKQLDFFLIKQP